MDKPASINLTQTNNNKIILITGANGFVGSHLVNHLSKISNYEIRACIRKKLQLNFSKKVNIFSNLDLIDLIEINKHTWDLAISNVDFIIHCAARVHIANEKFQDDALTKFRKINVEATLELARKAIDHKVKRFIYISTIKVNGENSLINQPFSADDKVNPSDPYAISKMEAEQKLLELAKNNYIEIVIIRPPLIYGPMVKANFKSMITLINKYIPLPFKNINNKRSLVSIDNLIDFIQLCIIHPKAANQIFLVSDGQDLSTSELLTKIAKILNKRLIWLPIPNWLITYIFRKFFKKYKFYNKLIGNLQIDLNKNERLLSWKPIIDIDTSLKNIVKSFK